MSINDPIETLKLSHEDVTLDYTLMRQGNHGYAEQSKKPPKEGVLVVILNCDVLFCVFFIEFAKRNNPKN